MNSPAGRVATLGEEVRVRGLVQGVGFRPAVWLIARDCGLSGDVCNDGEGVLIRIWGPATERDRFLTRLRDEHPPLARIDEVVRGYLREDPPEGPFGISTSRSGHVHTGAVPDAATCPACLGEIFDPFNRRYRYPFTNCTHCGPRFSILEDIPYDRAHTSMGVFPFCRDCRAEYENPEDRRFHAQPVACHACGPKARLVRLDGHAVSADRYTQLDAVDAATNLLKSGEIVLIKGLGGFHLACDATNDRAVSALRLRKHRPHKPLALMARDLDVVRRYAHVSRAEEKLLQSHQAPIVLLNRLDNDSLAPGIAPGMRRLGFMLPYTPLHHLLMRLMERPIVLTSGNLSDAPQVIDDTAAVRALRGVTDWMLTHDRAIINRVDDSVVQMAGDDTMILRRGRGYAPESLPLPEGFGASPDLLALGGELKNTFCLIKDGQAILSQHMGDLEQAAVWDDTVRNLALYARLFQHVPKAVVVDRHPEYLSRKWGVEMAEEGDLPLISVQHHHAHIAAVMAEHGLPLEHPPVIALALDGMGLGDGGALWGCECLQVSYREIRHLGGLRPSALPGGSLAMREPWRNAFVQLADAFGWSVARQRFADLAIVEYLAEKPVAQLLRMRDRNVGVPLCSSAGRLFDAVSAVCGLCMDRVSHEGQAAMLLEDCVDPSIMGNAAEPGYPFGIVESEKNFVQMDPRTLWQPLLGDLQGGVPVATIAARFHKGFAAGLAQLLRGALGATPWTSTVALSGGVFQNLTLLRATREALESQGLEVLVPHLIPANDGGLAFGQAVVAAAQIVAGQHPIAGGHEPCV
ncbi:carbamoyltransferase HypF [Acidithiobacillus sp.]|uniref:carbamoyltransferase HypF n=1 Tax=Acidithiobacillus sp. TaxID=1872118 RepID=UPI003CFFD1E7